MPFSNSVPQTKMMVSILTCCIPFSVKSGPHPCSVCKATVDQSRAVTHKSLALLLGLREDDLGPDTRACNNCYAKAQRKKHAHCPIPSCTTSKGRVKGRLRHMPKKWSYLPKDIREAISSDLRKILFK